MPLPPVLQQSQQQRHLVPSGGGLPALCKRQGATQSPLGAPWEDTLGLLGAYATFLMLNTLTRLHISFMILKIV